MIFFEVLTGRVAFEDSQEKMWRNMRIGPTRVCDELDSVLTQWSNQQTCFSFICWIFRYVKRLLVISSDHSWMDSPLPPVWIQWHQGWDATELSLPGKFCSDPLPVTHTFSNVHSQDWERSNISHGDKFWIDTWHVKQFYPVERQITHLDYQMKRSGLCLPRLGRKRRSENVKASKALAFWI